MYVVRDIFQLKFGHYKDVKALLDEASKNNMFASQSTWRYLTDFTGDGYRLIMEHNYKTLGDYEQEMMSMGKPEWQQWYAKFKEHVIGSNREILKQVM